MRWIPNNLGLPYGVMPNIQRLRHALEGRALPMEIAMTYGLGHRVEPLTPRGTAARRTRYYLRPDQGVLSQGPLPGVLSD